MTKRRIGYSRRKRTQTRPTNDRADELLFFHDRPESEFACPVYRIRLLSDLLSAGELCAQIYFRLREAELPRWIKARPGTRPPLWWVFDTDSPRLGLQPFQRSPDHQRDEQGRPSRDRVFRDHEAGVWVPEPRYLAAQGLLTPAERRVLPPEIMKPKLKLIVTTKGEDHDE
jgi:hypothetical protein